MFADYHVHTSYSDDSEYPMEEVVRDAVSLGLEEICFTDHVDYGVKRDWDDPSGILYRQGRSGEPEHMALAQERIHQRGLSRIDVGDNGYINDFLKI